MTDSGHIFYQDAWFTIYDIQWNTTGGNLDITSTVSMPHVWGQPDAGYFTNGILFKRGIITITRQVLRPLPAGYEIVAEGVSQYIDYIQMDWPCQVGPQDPFRYHLDRPFVDDVYALVSSGSRWADPDLSADLEMVWGDVAGDGTPLPVGVTVGGAALEFIDVWA